MSGQIITNSLFTPENIGAAATIVMTIVLDMQLVISDLNKNIPPDPGWVRG